MKDVGIKQKECGFVPQNWREVFLSQPSPGSEGLGELLGMPEVVPGLQQECGLYRRQNSLALSCEQETAEFHSTGMNWPPKKPSKAAEFQSSEALGWFGPQNSLKSCRVSLHCGFGMDRPKK